jgi:hypothetical protein
MNVERSAERPFDEAAGESRGRFLRRVGKMAIAGLGLSLLGASRAKAVPVTCCPANDQHPCIPNHCQGALQCNWCSQPGGGCYICTQEIHNGCWTTQCCPC